MNYFSVHTNVKLYCFLLQVSVNGIKGMVSFVESVIFQSLYPGNHYIIPKRLSHDVVESFFFSAKALLWGDK